MTIYPYRNDAGDEREIVGSMKNPPPEIIVIFADGSWMEPDDLKFEEDDPRLDELRSTPGDERVFRRVFGAGLRIQAPDYAVKPGKGGLPVSVASPRRKGGKVVKRGDHTVREHSDGSHTTLSGQPIIDSSHAAKENARRTGMELD